MITTGNDATWEEVQGFLRDVKLPFQYAKTFVHQNNNINLTIDIDPGGGFESGYEFTSLTAPVPVQFTSLSSPLPDDQTARFALHDAKVIDRIGKFFGAEDVELGYPEFDQKLIVKTNNREFTRKVFHNEEARAVFRDLKEFSLEIVHHPDTNPAYTLELMID